MQLKPAVLGVLVLVVFLGTVGASMVAGAWATTGRSGDAGGDGGGRVELASGADPGDVKGWMAAGDVADAFNVPLAELLAAFELPADTEPSTPLKELESETFGVPALRDWLAARAP